LHDFIASKKNHLEEEKGLPLLFTPVWIGEDAERERERERGGGREREKG
jgi:hypothetical protein